MADPQDILEIDGVVKHGDVARKDEADAARSRFLSIWFRCCHTYGRLYRNREHTAYEGRCPRCAAKVRAMIGPGGTKQRMFEAG